MADSGICAAQVSTIFGCSIHRQRTIKRIANLLQNIISGSPPSLTSTAIRNFHQRFGSSHIMWSITEVASHLRRTDNQICQFQNKYVHFYLPNGSIVT